MSISSCSKCGEARYCSQACQKSAWQGWASAGVTGVVGHKLWCGTLRAAPRPLRLIHRLVCSAKLEALGLVKLNSKTTDSDPKLPGHDSFWDTSDRSMGVDVDVHFADTIFSAKRGMTPSAADALRALMDKIKPSRIVLVVPHMWAHSGSGSGETRSPDVTLFEVGLTGDEGARDGDSRGLSKYAGLCDALIKSVETALPYMFAEEDRLSEGVRYAPSSGFPNVGTPCPPRMARMQGAKLGPGDIVTDAGYMGNFGGGVAVMGPARWRWATMGPFQMSEMPLEDLQMSRLQFFKPLGWPAGWFTVVTELVA